MKMNIDIKYIQENFIESKELCRVTGISYQELEELIKKEFIPNASYKVDSTCKISSPLGDEKVIFETKKYFPKNITDLIKTNNILKTPSALKKMIKAEFTETFVNNTDNKFGYGNILNENGSVNMKKLDLAFEQEWQSYLQGIYGICTLNGTGAEIAKKEIAVKKLIDFNQKHKDKELTESEKQVFLKLNSEYNEVSNLFAPFQRKNSSRGKYLDKILEQNALPELIKNYN